jgi:hypothetical protein
LKFTGSLTLLYSGHIISGQVKIDGLNPAVATGLLAGD